jgi:hypothetical protein
MAQYRTTGCCRIGSTKTLSDQRSRVKLIPREIIYAHRLGVQFHFLPVARIVRFVRFANALTSHNAGARRWTCEL